MIRQISALLGLSMLICSPAAAQVVADARTPAPRQRVANGSEARTVRALRISGEAPLVDGRLDETFWRRSGSIADFVQFRPDAGSPPSERTEAWVAYDDEALYVGVRLHDSRPDSIAAQLLRRDEDGYSDWIYVGIDSYFDRRTAFVFALNPRGVKKDLLIYDDTNEDGSWDAVWEGAAAMDSAGWTAEFKVPLSQLRFSAASEHIWGIQLHRVIARRQEQSVWAPMPENPSRVVGLFGELHGLRDLEPGRRLEVQPYSVASVTRAPGAAGDPFHSEASGGFSVGADVKYGLTSDLTLTATLNPDFGQVEADPSEVNLSAFESFFPEKRPFFMEGVDIFHVGLGIGDGDFGNESLFYTRRIGRAPQVGLPSEAQFESAPGNTTILGAAKLSGKTASGWSVGVLDAVTARESGRWINAAGEEAIATVEPMTNYGVVRVKKDFRDGRSMLGGIFTSTHRELDASTAFLREAAYAGGVDARHRFGENVLLNVKLLGSYVAGDTLALQRTQRSSTHYFQRPDAEHLEYDPAATSLGGWQGSLELLKIGGGNWHYGGALIARSPGFEVNDLGFQPSSDYILQAAFAGYSHRRPSTLLRRWNVGVNQWSNRSFAGEPLEVGGNVNGGFQLHNYWGANAGLNVQLGGYSVHALRGGPALRRPAAANLWFGMYSDRRKPVGGSLNGTVSWESQTGSRSYRIAPAVEARPSTRVELSLAPSLSWSDDQLQYVTRGTVGGQAEYVFANLDRTTAALTARLSYTFTPTLSLQLYAQPFISTGHFGDYMAVRDPKAEAFEARFGGYTEGREIRNELDERGRRRLAVDPNLDGEADFRFGEPSFSIRELRSNAVVRWEWSAGSSLYLVWSHGRVSDEYMGGFDLREDADLLFTAPSTHVLLIKASYWLGL